MILDAILVNLIILSFCIAITSVLMAFTESSKDKDKKLQANIEYGIFSVAGLASAVLVGYGYFS